MPPKDPEVKHEGTKSTKMNVSNQRAVSSSSNREFVRNFLILSFEMIGSQLTYSQSKSNDQPHILVLGFLRVLRVFVFNCLCLFMITGCGRTINRSAERKIRDALPAYIGPARVWRAHVDNPPERTLSGRLRNLTIDGEEVEMKQTIYLESLHIEMRDVEVDTGRQRLKAVKDTSFRAVIGEAALNDYIRNFPPPPEEPVRVRHVQIREGKLYAEATRRLPLGASMPFTSTVEPVLVSDTRLMFDPDRMTVFGLPVPLPAGALRWLTRRLSDGFDFSTLPFPVKISRFRAESGRVVIEGTADVMPSLNERIGAYLGAETRSEPASTY
jgi:hypothetical protein